MQGKIARILMGLIALAMVLAFFAPVALKLKDPALIVVLLIGIGAIVASTIEFIRDEGDH